MPRFRYAEPFSKLFWKLLGYKLAKLALLSLAIAWLLSWTSSQTSANIPAALFLVLLFHWLSNGLAVVDSEQGVNACLNRRRQRFRGVGKSDFYYKEKVRDPPDRDAWKKSVNAPIVESAWESFCGSIVQEWVYDSWFSILSPDREFPAEIRRLLNEAFAEVAQRAKKIDLRAVLIRDMCDLFTEQLELYRATKMAVGVLKEGDLSLDKKDRAFQQEMKTDRTLHSAFYARDGHYRMIRRMAEGVVGIILTKEDVQRPLLRSLGRELVATCVLRSIIMLFTPYNANKILLSLLKPRKERKHQKNALTSGGSRDDDLLGSYSQDSRGCLQFEQRVRASVAKEKLAIRRTCRTPQPTKDVALPSQSTSIPRSRSHSELEVLDSKELLESSDSDGVRSVHSAESLEDLKCSLEETDLLAVGGKHGPELMETTPANGSFTQTSLPWIPTSPMSGATAGMEESDASVMSLIDSQVPVEHMSFMGHPRARVVAPEINTAGGREFVVFKIRVADQSGEWTVTRRYRNFEALHKTLRDLPAYRELQPRLPAKAFVFQTHKTEFVEERRVALDRYLQSLLSCESLAFNRYVWLFLSDQECRSFTPNIRVGLVKTIANNVESAHYRLKRTITDTLHDSQARLDVRKEDALRLLDASESSSIAGSVKIDDDGAEAAMPAVTKSRSQHGGAGWNVESAMRRNASVPESIGETVAVVHEGRHAQQNSAGHGKAQRRVAFGRLNEDNDDALRNKLPGDLSNASLLSRFDTQDRDAIGRQAENNAAAGVRRSPFMKRTTSWGRVTSSGSDDDDSSVLDFDDYAGISAPLYEVADAIFVFPAQKFFRRQVFQVMRQVLSFLAGDAIDVYLNEKIKRLRSEHTLARMIHFLKSTLWPSGVWFTKATETEPSDETSHPKNPPSQGLRADSYLDETLVQSDAREVAERLETRLFRHAPAALVRLVGRHGYMCAMKDVYDMIQLPTYVRQIGYGVVEIVLLALFPELKELFAKIHREARRTPEPRSA